MAFLSATTSVGIAAAEVALSNGVQIAFNSATFSSDILAQNTATLAAVTSLAHVVYSANAAQLAYRALPDGKTAMVRVSLPTTAAFNFGSYSINLVDGTPFIVGTWDTTQVKSNGALRYIEQRFVLSNLLPTLNLTILTNIDAAIPEVAHETDLPAANTAPYPLYLVDSHSGYTGHPALASPVGGTWQYYPCDFTYLTAGTYNTLGVDTKGRIISVGNTNYVLRAGDTMTGDLTIATGSGLHVNQHYFTSDIDTGMSYAGVSGGMNFLSDGALKFQILSGGIGILTSLGITGALTVAGAIGGSTMNLSGAAGISGALTVGGALSGSTMNLSGAGTVGGTLNTAGTITANGARVRAGLGALGSGDANAVAILSDFPVLSVTAGQIVLQLPNGIIIQMSVTAVFGNGAGVPFENPVTLPHAYPFSSHFWTAAGFSGNTPPNNGVTVSSRPLNATQVGISINGAAAIAYGVWFISVGS